jgi:hypothetical protein
MNTANEHERSEIEDLLPWHAAGTLSRREAQRVEAALANDPELARRYELVREELAQTIHLNETLGAPSARAMAALFAKIDAEPARRPAASINLGARIAEFFTHRSPRTLAWSGIAAALVILLQAALITGILHTEKGPSSYETASAPPTNIGGEGAYVLMRFRPQANAADIAKFLQIHKFNVSDGPSAGGLYRVRVAAGKLQTADLARVVQTLQGNKIVDFIAATK